MRKQSILVPVEIMVTRLKAKDLPQPWHSSGKKTAGNPRTKSTVDKLSAVLDCSVDDVQEVVRKKGQPSGKSAAKVATGLRGTKKMKALTASAVNILLGVAPTSVADVEELRRKRQVDAEASGRTVRTVSPKARSRKTPVAVTGYCTAEEEDQNSPLGRLAGACVPPPQTSRAVPSTEEKSRKKVDAISVLEDAEQEREPIPSQRPGKEPVKDYVDELSPRNECQQERQPPHRSHVGMDSDNDLRQSSPQQHSRRRRLVLLSTKKYSRDRYVGSKIELSDSEYARHSSHRQQLEEFASMKSRCNLSRGSDLPDSEIHHGRHSRSPVRWTASHPQSSKKNVARYYDYPSDNRLREEYKKSPHSSSRGLHRRSQYASSSPESSRQQGRRRSEERGRSSHRQSTPLCSSVSPPRRSNISRDDMRKGCRDVIALKVGDSVETSAASDRRRRRRQQALLDADNAKRQRNGKKPFYLTLDREGRPYGTGKPTWIAEINKLAISLDPSCTNIRKQTFEDVQTFKNRLDDNFEYSGTLNDDYLRALMGRAVTKRRSELISLIKRDGLQPEYIDEQVWHQLEKLAMSKQREERSEQGRYANTCRRTLGRTGCRGVDGVREKLRTLLGRSPDPSEVEDEMQRDKGYGGQRKKKRNWPIKKEFQTSKQLCHEDEDRPIRRSRRSYHQVNSDSSYDGGHKQQVVVVAEADPHFNRRGQSGWNDLKEDMKLAGTTATGLGSAAVKETNNTSKENYIRELEAQIKLLRQGKANVSPSNADASSLLYLQHGGRS